MVTLGSAIKYQVSLGKQERKTKPTAGGVGLRAHRDVLRVWGFFQSFTLN